MIRIIILQCWYVYERDTELKNTYCRDLRVYWWRLSRGPSEMVSTENWHELLWSSVHWSYRLKVSIDISSFLEMPFLGKYSDQSILSELWVLKVCKTNYAPELCVMECAESLVSGHMTWLLHQLWAAMAARARSSQPKFQHELGRGPESPILSEELLAVDDYWGSESHSFKDLGAGSLPHANVPMCNTDS